MTTNVLDLENGIATCDSRWSIDTPKFFVYVDETGFEKIVERNRFVLLFAGNASLIQQFIDFIDTDGEVPRPAEEEMRNRVSISITNAETGMLVFEREQIDPICQNARFAGSGALHAMRCWLNNKCAMTAVATAISMDMGSGGEIKYYSFDGGTNILRNRRSDVIVKAMSEKGMIMLKDSSAAIPIQDAAKIDESVKELLDDISSGKLEPCAPSVEMYIPWDANDLRRLDRALNMVLSKR